MPQITIELTQEQLDSIQASGESVQEVVNRVLYRKQQAEEHKKERLATLEVLKKNANRIQ